MYNKLSKDKKDSSFSLVSDRREGYDTPSDGVPLAVLSPELRKQMM
jgi:hypothetical protein